MLNNLKSHKILADLFSFISKKKKLLLMKHSKAMQSKLNLKAKDYNTGKYMLKNQKGERLEYLIDSNILVFKGFYTDEYRNGPGEEYHLNSQLKFQGNFVYGGKELGKEFFWNGVIQYDGHYINNRKWNGIGYDINQRQIYKIVNGACDNVVEYDDYGQIIYEGPYRNGERCGKGKEYKDGALVFEGDFKNGKKNGSGKEFFGKEEICFEGNYLNDLREGKGTEYFYCINREENNIKFDGVYKFGRMWTGIGYNLFDKNKTFLLEKGSGKNVEEYNDMDILIYEGDYENEVRCGESKDIEMFKGTYILNELMKKKECFYSEFEQDFFYDDDFEALLEYIFGKECFLKGIDYVLSIMDEIYDLMINKENFVISSSNKIAGNYNLLLKPYLSLSELIINIKDELEDNNEQKEIQDNINISDKNLESINYTIEIVEIEDSHKLKEMQENIILLNEKEKYIGGYQNLKRNGEGELYKLIELQDEENNSNSKYDYILTYEGEFLNGLFHGKGKEYIYLKDKINHILFEGEFNKGKKINGISYNPFTGEKTIIKNCTGKVFESTNPNCDLLEVFYSEGKEKDIVEEYIRDPLSLEFKLQYEGNYANGKRNGKGVFFYYDKEGKKNEVETVFFNNERNGKAIINKNKVCEYKKGKIWNCEEFGIREGKKDNIKITINKDKNSLHKELFYEGELFNGNLTGKGILLSNNLSNNRFEWFYKIFEGKFLNGKAYGKSVGNTIYRNGFELDRWGHILYCFGFDIIHIDFSNELTDIHLDEINSL